MKPKIHHKIIFTVLAIIAISAIIIIGGDKSPGMSNLYVATFKIGAGLVLYIDAKIIKHMSRKGLTPWADED